MQTDLYYIQTISINEIDAITYAFWYIKPRSQSNNIWSDPDEISEENLPTAVNIYEAKCIINRDKSLNDTLNWRYLLVPATSTPIQVIQ